MGRLDDLVAQVADRSLRQQLETALADMKRRQRFGLVYEEHVPEMTALHGLPIQAGSLVQRRNDPQAKTLYRVSSMTSQGQATVESSGGGEPEQAPVGDLLAVKRFGEPIYPSLTSLGSVRRGGDDKPHHAVINGENFHALQLLVYQFEGQVDCIYIDPPYNTGARDWKYNNRYVDDSDAWQHSKWLSFMEKRLRLAKLLLKPDGVLVVTVDANELHHLGMLLEKLFPEHLRYMVNIIINPKGVYKQNFARIEEQALYCCPQVGRDVIAGARADFMPDESDIFIDLDDESDELFPDDARERVQDSGAHAEPEYEYGLVRRRGSSSRREDRPSMFYPLYVDDQARRVVRAGESIALDDEPAFDRVDGLLPVWPINKKGQHGRWQVGAETMQKLIDAGDIVLGAYNRAQNSWTINRRGLKKVDRKLKTVWRRKSHDAGTHGTVLLGKILGEERLFPFPKSVYAVRDCVAPVVRERPNALIVDFFAGSGTTFHATCLLNAEDAGSRRCILVTNNEVA